MNNHIFVMADGLLHYEQKTLEFREKAYKALIDANINVHGVVAERREGKIHLAVWQKGVIGSHSADATLDSFVSGHPNIFNYGLVITQTELLDDGTYDTRIKTFHAEDIKITR